MSASQKKPKPANNNYMKYSGMALQFGVMTFVGAFLGGKLDERLGTERPYMAALFALLFLLAAFYIVFKDLMKNP